MSKVQVKGKVVVFNGIEKTKDSITITGDNKERLTVTFKKDTDIEQVFNSVGIAITQHLVSDSDTAFPVCDYLEKEGYSNKIVSFSTGEETNKIEEGELPKVTYRYKNKFGIITGVEQPIDLDDLEEIELEGTTLVIHTHPDKITIDFKPIKNINVLDFAENYIRLMILKAYKYNTPIQLDDILEELEEKFLLDYTVSTK